MRYRVMWEVDVTADSPVEAAKAARKLQEFGTPILEFDVYERSQHEVSIACIHIDLTEHGGDPLVWNDARIREALKAADRPDSDLVQLAKWIMTTQYQDLMRLPKAATMAEVLRTMEAAKSISEGGKKFAEVVFTEYLTRGDR